MDIRIVEFIKAHHVLALATQDESGPYICSCFYTYMDQEQLLVFTSEARTRHAVQMDGQARVAAAVALETTMVGKIQGVQITGQARLLEGALKEQARKAYLKQFPVARLSNLHLWGLEPEFIKMTHNQLGFGKKLIWEKGARETILK